MSLPPTYDNLSYERSRALISQTEAEPIESQSPQQWFDVALRQAEAARQAERRNSKSGMYVAYTRLAIAYQKCWTHPKYKEAKASDSQWAARVKDFNSNATQAIHKAKALKDELKAMENKSSASKQSKPNGSTATSQPASPTTQEEHGGSIADRMKALRGHGMNVGSSSKRVSHDLGERSNGSSPSVATQGAAHSIAPTRHDDSAPSSSSTSVRQPSVPRTATRDASRPPASIGGPRPPTESVSGPKVEPPSVMVPHSTGSSSKSRREASVLGSPSKSPGGTSLSALSEDAASHATQPKPPIHHPQPLHPIERATSSHDDPEKAEVIDRFSATFPSLEDLGKHFDDHAFTAPPLHPPNGNSERSPLPEPPKQPPGDSHVNAEEFLSFPTLPSVPTDLPGGQKPRKPLPPPPPRPDDLEMRGGPPSPPHIDSDMKPPSPPRPDLLQDPNRPASTLGFSEQARGFSPSDSADDLIARRFAALSSPTGASSRASRLPPVPPPHGAMSPTVGVSSPLSAPGHADLPVSSPTTDALPSVPTLSFPKPSPSAPPQRLADTSAQPSSHPPQEGAEKLKKPDFPFTNSIEPPTLREYLLNPAVDVLLLDVRPEEEFAKGFVGAEYHQRRHVNIVWLDPHVLMRSNLTTSEQLEDALSLSTDAQRLAFENRHRYDLVVVYDTKSTSFPTKGAPATPVSRLWSIIAENEFVKPLPRFPTLLIGGYDGWVKFIKARGEMHAREFARQRAQQAERDRAAAPPPIASPRTNGHAVVPLGRSQSNSSVTSGRGREKYQMSPTQDLHENAPYGLHRPQSSSGHKYSGSMAGSYQPYQPHHPSSPTRGGMPRASHGSSQSLSTFGSSSLVQNPSSYSTTSTIAAPPRASVHAGAMTRRQSSGYDTQGYTGYSPSLSSIDYPQAHALVQVPQPPPAAVSHTLERQDQRMPRTISTRNVDQLVPNSGVRYWVNTKLGLTGLKNLGNTCYMNSTIQCLSATLPFARYFLDGRYKGDINQYNPLGTKGDLANTFAKLLSALWGENWNVLSPISFRKSIVSFKSDFAGTDQHDSQEFLSFVMDGLHEDLNRIKVKPKPVEMTPEREHALETLPPQIASDREWAIYKQRNDSFIVDLFQGQYMNRMECLTCHKTSTVYDSFQWLTLDLPPTKAKVVLPELLDRWVKPEILDGDEKWYCPRCKTHRRASKTLTLVRLPPVLLIQLKRFIPVNGGRFWDKSETPVIFPLQGLDLTRYVPPRQQEPGMDMNDPRTQVGPFKYDLYGVSNHMGTLSSGHYTAYVRSSGQWMYAEDSRVTPAREVDVMSRPAYILFYKRVPPQ